MDKERDDIANKIYWLLIKEGQNHLCSMPLGQRMFFYGRGRKDNN